MHGQLNVTFVTLCFNTVLIGTYFMYSEELQTI